MTRFPTIQNLTLAALFAATANPAHAIMFRPELGMGMTDYISALAQECPAALPGVAMDQNWRPGMPCVALVSTDDPNQPTPKLYDDEDDARIKD